MNVYEHIQGYPGKRGQIFITYRRGRTGEKSLRFFARVAHSSERFIHFCMYDINLAYDKIHET